MESKYMVVDKYLVLSVLSHRHPFYSDYSGADISVRPLIISSVISISQHWNGMNN